MHSPLVAGAVLLELCQAVDDATLAGLVGGAQAPLAAWLTAPPADASPDALLLALRLWPRLPAAAAEACPLLPAGFAAKKLLTRCAIEGGLLLALLSFAVACSQQCMHWAAAAMLACCWHACVQRPEHARCPAD